MTSRSVCKVCEVYVEKVITKIKIDYTHSCFDITILCKTAFAHVRLPVRPQQMGQNMLFIFVCLLVLPRGVLKQSLQFSHYQDLLLLLLSMCLTYPVLSLCNNIEPSLMRGTRV